MTPFRPRKYNHRKLSLFSLPRRPRSTLLVMKPSKKRSKKRSNPPPPPALPPTQAATEEEDARNLNWLIGAFETASLDQITSAYGVAGGDVYKAAGILGAELVDPGEGVKRTAEARRPKRAASAAAAGIVPDVIGKEYLKGGRSGGGGSVGRRYSTEEGEEFLCSMLGEESELGMGVIRDVLGECGCNVEKALDMLLEISASSYANFRKKGFDDFKRGSKDCSGTRPEIFDNNPRENITSSFQLTDETSDFTYQPFEEEHKFQQYEGFAWSRDRVRIAPKPLPLPDGFAKKLERPNIRDKYEFRDSQKQPPSKTATVKLDLQQKVLETLFNIRDTSPHEPKCMDWKKAVKKVESFGQGLEFQWASIVEPLQNVKNGKGDGYTEFRSTARKHWDEMRNSYQKAAVAYSGGQRAHAAYLSEKGRNFSKLAREADQKASLEIFENRNKDIKNTITIDLHGQHVKQAVGLLKMHLLLFTYIPSIQFLKVITGSGAVGVGRGKLKHTVIGLLQRESIEWSEENSGTLVLRVDGPKDYSFAECSDSD